MASTTTTTKQVEWAALAQRLRADGISQQQAADELLEALALDANATMSASDVAKLLASALTQVPTSSADTYVAPLHAQLSTEETVQRHAARSAAITTVVSQAVTQGLLHDDSPLINLFDWDAFTARLENLRSALPEPQFIHAVAVKANPLRGILREAQARGFGAECASFAEAKHALALGFAPHTVVFDSPCKTEREIKELLRAGVYINLDNATEVEKVERVIAQLDAECGSTSHFDSQIGLRINPVVGSGSIDALSTATASSKFGLPLTAATRDRLIALYTQHKWLQGVHVHVGSQGCPIELLVAGAKRAVAFALAVNAAVGRPQITVVDIGGGLPTVYDGGVTEAYDFKEYSTALRTQVPELFTTGFSRIITEFGRALFVKPGITVSKVEAVKDWAGQAIAVIHVGADQFPRTAYLPALWSHVITVLASDGHVKVDASDTFVPQDIAGPLCFSGDFLAKQLLLPRVAVRDLIVLHDTGGYTIAMQSKYNSRQASAVFAYSRKRDGSIAFALLKARESVDETLAFWGIDESVAL